MSGHVKRPGQLRGGDGQDHLPGPHLRPRATAAASATTTSSRRSSPAAPRRPGSGREHLDVPLDQDEVGARTGPCSGPARSSPWTTPRAWCGPPGGSSGSSTGSRAASAPPAGRAAGWLEKILAAHRGRPGPGVRPRPADGRLRQHRPRPDLAPRQTTICPLGPSIPSPIALGDPHVPGRVSASTSRRAAARMPAEPPPGRAVTINLGRPPGRPAVARRDDHRRRRTSRRLHSPLLLPPTDEAGRDVPHVPGRSEGPPRLHPDARLLHPRRRGQEIVTDSPAVKKAQDGVLEFLLVNHPLDCPVCDKGGECPLQDQTLAFGPGETRFVEEKRHWDKPINLSPRSCYLDRERCIQCARCTRFADEIAGDPLIDFADAGRRDRGGHLSRRAVLPRTSAATWSRSARSAP